jgi:hypothetical protein
MIYAALYLILCVACLILYVWTETKSKDVDLSTFLAMVFVSVFPITNILVAAFLLREYAPMRLINKLFDKVIFKSRK